MASRYLEPAIERRSRAAMTRWQSARLRAQIRHAAANSPFYRRKLQAAGVDPKRIRGLADLRHLPFTTKD
jgi:phenylacetate-CoA ligase